jgi:hypothetical protein
MRPLILAALCLSLFACGKKSEEPPVKILETQRQAIDQAKGVEQTLQQAATAQKQEIDKQSGDAPSK